MTSIATRARRAACAAGVALAGLSAAPATAQDSLDLALPSKMFLNLVELVAQDEGFYEDENLDVSISHIADSSVPVRSLISGDSDIIEAGMAETLIARGRGAEVKTIGSIHTGLHYALWTREGSGIEGIEDFRGKNIAVSSLGSLPHVVILALLERGGVEQSEIDTINWVSVRGSSARRNAILAGTVDATVASYSPQAERAEGINLLAVVGPELPDYVMIPWDTTISHIENERDLLYRFIKAEILALRHILDNKEQVLDVAANHFDYTKEDLDAFYEFYANNIWDPNGLINEDAAMYMQELNVSSGMQDEVLPVEQVLDQSITREVLDEIGRYE